MLRRIDTFTLAVNTTIGAVAGGILGLSTTAIVMIIFSVVSVSRPANFYFGGLFMLFGVLLLYRICRRRG